MYASLSWLWHDPQELVFVSLVFSAAALTVVIKLCNLCTHCLYAQSRSGHFKASLAVLLLSIAALRALSPLCHIPSSRVCQCSSQPKTDNGIVTQQHCAACTQLLWLSVRPDLKYANNEQRACTLDDVDGEWLVAEGSHKFVGCQNMNTYHKHETSTIKTNKTMPEIMRVGVWDEIQSPRQFLIKHQSQRRLVHGKR